MSDKQTYFLSTYLLLEKENEILLLKRKNTGWFDGFYSLIAGHAGPKECAFSTIIREAKEEVGICIQKRDLKLLSVAQRFDGKNRHYVEYFFLTKNWQGNPKNIEPHKCEEIVWIEKNHISDKKIVPHVIQSLQAIERKEFFHSIGFNETSLTH